MLAYPLDEESGARSAVEYEVLRYQTTHGLPLPEGASLRETALYNNFSHLEEKGWKYLIRLKD